MKRLAFIGLFLLPGLSLAANNGGITLQCAGYKLELIPDSIFRINGEYVTSQKIKTLGDGNGMKADMGLMPARDGNNCYYQKKNNNCEKLHSHFTFTQGKDPMIFGASMLFCRSWTFRKRDSVPG